MKRRSKIKLLGHIIQKKLQGATSQPPADGFLSIQRRLSSDARLKSIINQKFSARTEQPPVNGFSLIQKKLELKLANRSNVKRRIGVALTMIIFFLICLFFIPSDFSREFSEASESITHLPILNHSKKSDSPETISTHQSSSNEEQEISINKSSDISDSIGNVKGYTSTEPNTIEILSSEKTESAEHRYEMEDQQTSTNHIYQTDERTNEAKPILKQNLVLLNNLAFKSNLFIRDTVIFSGLANSDRIDTAYYEKGKKWASFFQVQMLTNQMVLESNPGNPISLSDNQNTLSQKVGFKIGAGALFPLNTKIRLGIGVQYLSFSSKLIYDVYEPINGLDTSLEPVYYPVKTDIRESINIQSLTGTVKAEFDIYREHYLGIAYGHDVSSNDKYNISNISIYLGLASFRFGKLQYVIEPHFSHFIYPGQHAHFSFNVNTVGINLKLLK